MFLGMKHLNEHFIENLFSICSTRYCQTMSVLGHFQFEFRVHPLNPRDFAPFSKLKNDFEYENIFE